MKDRISYYPEASYVKTCIICEFIFYPKSNKAIFCCDACKQRCYILRKKQREGYSGDPNKGVILPAGTIPSQEIPEEKLVYYGFKPEMLEALSNYVSRDNLPQEKRHIDQLESITDTMDWFVSSIQVFTDQFLLEVMRVNSRKYKLYAWKWDSENEKPFLNKS